MEFWERELAEVRRRTEERSYAAADRFAQWRSRVQSHIDDTSGDVAAAESADDGPPEHRAVIEQIDSGELDWSAVMSGDVDDPAQRAMSVWMDRRLQMIEEVGGLMRDGRPIEDAYAEADR